MMDRITWHEFVKTVEKCLIDNNMSPYTEIGWIDIDGSESTQTLNVHIDAENNMITIIDDYAK